VYFVRSDLSRRDDQVKMFGGQRDEAEIVGTGYWLARASRIGPSRRDSQRHIQYRQRSGRVVPFMAGCRAEGRLVV
jgi:hypothetical protein